MKKILKKVTKAKNRESNYVQVELDSELLLRLEKDGKISIDQKTLQIVNSKQAKRQNVIINLPNNLVSQLEADGDVRVIPSKTRKLDTIVHVKMYQEKEDYATRTRRAHNIYRDTQNVDLTDEEVSQSNTPPPPGLTDRSTEMRMDVRTRQQADTTIEQGRLHEMQIHDQHMQHNPERRYPPTNETLRNGASLSWLDEPAEIENSVNLANGLNALQNGSQQDLALQTSLPNEPLDEPVGASYNWNENQRRTPGLSWQALDGEWMTLAGDQEDEAITNMTADELELEKKLLELRIDTELENASKIGTMKQVQNSMRNVTSCRRSRKKVKRRLNELKNADPHLISQSLSNSPMDKVVRETSAGSNLDKEHRIPSNTFTVGPDLSLKAPQVYYHLTPTLPQTTNSSARRNVFNQTPMSVQQLEKTYQQGNLTAPAVDPSQYNESEVTSAPAILLNNSHMTVGQAPQSKSDTFAYNISQQHSRNPADRDTTTPIIVQKSLPNNNPQRMVNFAVQNEPVMQLKRASDKQTDQVQYRIACMNDRSYSENRSHSDGATTGRQSRRKSPHGKRAKKKKIRNSSSTRSDRSSSEDSSDEEKTVRMARKQTKHVRIQETTDSDSASSSSNEENIRKTRKKKRNQNNSGQQAGKPPQYEKGDNAFLFLEDFEDWLKDSNLGDKEAARRFKRAIKPQKHKMWIRELPKDESDRFPLLKKKFLKTFHNINRSKVKEFMQKPNESVEQYFERYHAANYGLPKGMQASLMLTFAENLKSEQASRILQKKINDGKVKSIWEAREMATELMERTTWKQLKETSVNAIETTHADDTVNAIGDNGACFGCGSMSHRVRGCPLRGGRRGRGGARNNYNRNNPASTNMQPQGEQGDRSTEPQGRTGMASNRGGRGGYGRGYTRGGMGRGACFRCKSITHQISNCPDMVRKFCRICQISGHATEKCWYANPTAPTQDNVPAPAIPTMTQAGSSQVNFNQVNSIMIKEQDCPSETSPEEIKIEEYDSSINSDTPAMQEESEPGNENAELTAQEHLQEGDCEVNSEHAEITVEEALAIKSCLPKGEIREIELKDEITVLELNQLPHHHHIRTVELGIAVNDNAAVHFRNMIVDSAASICCAGTKDYKAIGGLDQDLRPFYRNRVKSASETPLIIRGIATLDLLIKGERLSFDFLISDNLNTGFILGMNFISSHAGVLDSKKNELRIQMPKIKQLSNEQKSEMECMYMLEALPKIEERQETSKRDISLWKDVLIMPQETTVLKAVVNPAVNPGTYEIDLTINMKNRYPMIALIQKHLEVTPGDNIATISVRNKQDYPIELKRGMNLLQLTPIWQEESFVMSTEISNGQDAEPTDADAKEDKELVAFETMLKSEVTDNPDLEEALKPKAEEMLRRRRGAFIQEIKNLKRCNVHLVNVQLDTDVPVRLPNYRMSEDDLKRSQTYIADLLESGIIVPSVSPYNSPCLWTADGPRKRFVVDYRKLNKHIRQDSYPIPLVDEIVRELNNSSHFCHLDLRSSFNQIPLSEESQPMTNFSIPTIGSFMYTRVPYGLTIGSGVMMRILDYLLAPNKDHARGYIDDIVIHGPGTSEIIEQLDQVLGRLESAQLGVNPSKCKLFRKELDILGHNISAQGIKPQAEKLKAIKEFPVPKTIKQLRRFMGMVTYLKQHMPDFAEVARPLQRLTGKGKLLHLDAQALQAFHSLKDRLVSPPALKSVDLTKPLIITTDASDASIAAVLEQEIDGKRHLIDAVGRALNSAECAYSATETELLAIIYAIQKWRTYLQASPFVTQIYTDHQPLVYLKRVISFSGRMSRWLFTLLSVQHEIIYLKGKNNLFADALSRRTYLKELMEDLPVDMQTMAVRMALYEDFIKTHGEQDSEELRDFIELSRPRKETNSRTVKARKLERKKKYMAAKIVQKAVHNDSTSKEGGSQDGILTEPANTKETNLDWKEATSPNAERSCQLDTRKKEPQVNLMQTRSMGKKKIEPQLSPTSTKELQTTDKDKQRADGSPEAGNAREQGNQETISNDAPATTDEVEPQLRSPHDSENKQEPNYLEKASMDEPQVTFEEKINSEVTYTSEITHGSKPPENTNEDQQGNKEINRSKNDYDIKAPSELEQMLANQNFRNKTAEMQRKDDDIRNIIAYLEKGQLPSNENAAKEILLTHSEYYIEESSKRLFHIYKPKGKNEKVVEQLVLPSSMIPTMLALAHDTPLGGHHGHKKTYMELQNYCTFKNMYSIVLNYCASCQVCARRKTPKRMLKTPCIPNEIKSCLPFDEIEIDFIGPLTSSNNYKWILTMVCGFTRWGIAAPMRSTEASKVAEMLMKHLILRYGTPTCIRSDNGPQLRANLIAHLARLLDIRWTFGSPYSPTSQARIERWNQSLVNTLAMFCKRQPRTWSKHLPYAVLSYNASIHESTNHTPWELVHTFALSLPHHMALKPYHTDENLQTVQQYMQEVSETAERSRELAAEKDKNAKLYNQRYKNKGRVNYSGYSPGEKVWVYHPTIKLGVSKKLMGRKWRGPYVVLRKCNNGVTYELSTTGNRRLPHMVHANRLKKYIARSLIPCAKPVEDNYPHPLIDPIYYPEQDMKPLTGTLTTSDPEASQPVFEAEKIVDIREEEDGSMAFKVRWLGCDDTADQWIPATEINDHEMLKRFETERDIPRRLEEIDDTSDTSETCQLLASSRPHQVQPTPPEETHQTKIKRNNLEQEYQDRGQRCWGNPCKVGWYLFVCFLYVILLIRTPVACANNQQVNPKTNSHSILRIDKIGLDSFPQQVNPKPTAPLHIWPFNGKGTGKITDTEYIKFQPSKLPTKTENVFTEKNTRMPKRNQSAYNETHGTKFLAYDCLNAVHEAVVTVNPYSKCMDPAKRTLTGTLTYKAKVKKRNEHLTMFTIYRCKEFVAKMRCHETWLWRKYKHTKLESRQVSEEKCRQMLTSTTLHRDKWKKVRRGQYFLKTKDHYACNYDKTTHKKFIHKEIASYQAAVQGNDRQVRTRLTRTKCQYHDGTCLAEEDGTRLIWEVDNRIDFSLFENLGHLTIHQVGNWFLIPALYSGGPAQKMSKDGNNILLQGGLEIVKDAASKASEKVFNLLAKEYFKQFDQDDQINMLGAHITDLVSLLQAHVTLLHGKLCDVKGKVANLESFIMETIPQAAHRIQADAGADYIEAGDAMIKRKCLEILLEDYEIKWDRKFKGKCYKYFPIEYKGNLSFLELPSHRIRKQATQINCSARHLTFIKDLNGNLHAIEPQGKINIFNKAEPDYNNSLIYLKDEQQYSRLLKGDKREQLQPLSLLQLINEASAPIQELQKISNLGSGSVVNGILSSVGAVISIGVKAIGGVVETIGSTFEGVLDHLSKGTATVVKATGGGVAKIIDSSGKALGETEKGFAQIIRSIFGSLVTAVNTLGIIVIAGYLAYEKWKQTHRRPLRLVAPLRTITGEQNQGQEVGSNIAETSM